MFRSVLSLFLAVFLVLPQGVSAFEGAAPPAEERPPWKGGPVFWGALSLLNGALLTSSIIDLKFYESRADDVHNDGGDAGPYWDASSREKVMIGISAASLIFSLAALKSSWTRPSSEIAIVPIPLPAGPSPENRAELISLEGKVRYDTLFAAVAKEGESVPVESAGVVEDPIDAPVEETARAEPPAVDVDMVAGILSRLEPVEEEAPPPAVPEVEEAPPVAAPEEPERPATFSLQPYGVHVSSFRTLTRAEKEEAKWSERGERVVIDERKIPDKGTWFQIFIGNFENHEDAKEYANLIRARFNLDYAQAMKHSGF